MLSLLGESPSAIPPLLKSTCSTSGVSGTIVITASARSATSRPERHATPPAASSSGGTLLRLCQEQVVPTVAQVPCHGTPHDAKPDKTNFHGPCSFNSQSSRWN